MPDDFLFPECQPRCTRRMAVGGGHFLYVNECGPVDGLPVLFLHGGPGSGCTAKQRRLFDPERYRVILIDQRGAGGSLPLGEIESNTTADLVADLESVREALGIQSWIVFGGSWGSLLALSYAQLYRERVLGLVLRGIFFGSPDEIMAYLKVGQRIAPEAWTRFADIIPTNEQDDLLAAYARRILGDAIEARFEACLATAEWLNYERALMGEPPLTADPDPAQVAKARIQMHYLSHACFLDTEQLLAGVELLRHLPGAIVQGMADPVCPPQAAETLHHAWPEALWMPVLGAGHGAFDPPIARACIKALDWVAECARVNRQYPSHENH